MTKITNKHDGVTTAGPSNKLDGVTAAGTQDGASGEVSEASKEITPNNPRPSTAHEAGWVLTPGID